MRLLAVMLVCSSCLVVRRVPNENGPFLVAAPAALNADAATVADALKTALPLLAAQNRELKREITVQLVDSEKDLWRQTVPPNSWIKARARYASILLLAPSKWNPSREALVKLLVHEVSHCFSFQNLGSTNSWNLVEVPFWFLEGAPTLAGGQAPELPSLEDTARWVAKLKTNADEKLLAGDDENPREAYGLSLHAFAFFLKRFGREAPFQIEREISRGVAFDKAFETITTSSHAAFRKDLMSFLSFRAFRGMRFSNESPMKKMRTLDQKNKIQNSP